MALIKKTSSNTSSDPQANINLSAEIAVTNDEIIQAGGQSSDLAENENRISQEQANHQSQYGIAAAGVSPSTADASADQITFITLGSLYYRIAGGTNNLRLTEEIYSQLKNKSQGSNTTTWRDILKTMFQFYKLDQAGRPNLLQAASDSQFSPELFEARGVKETGLGRGSTDKQYSFIRRGGEVYFYREGSENSYYNVSNTHRNFGGFKQEYLPSGSRYYLETNEEKQTLVKGVKEKTYIINYHITKIGDYFFPVQQQSSSLGPFYSLIEITDTDTDTDTDTRKFITIEYDKGATPPIQYKSIECTNDASSFAYINDDGLLVNGSGASIDASSINGIPATLDTASTATQYTDKIFKKGVNDYLELDNQAVTNLEGYKFKIEDTRITTSGDRELRDGGEVDSTDSKHFGLFKDYRLIEEDKDVEIWYKSGSAALDDDIAGGLTVEKNITDYLIDDNHVSTENSDISGGAQYLPRVDYILSRRRSTDADLQDNFLTDDSLQYPEGFGDTNVPNYISNPTDSANQLDETDKAKLLLHPRNNHRVTNARFTYIRELAPTWTFHNGRKNFFSIGSKQSEVHSIDSSLKQGNEYYYNQNYPYLLNSNSQEDTDKSIRYTYPNDAQKLNDNIKLRNLTSYGTDDPEIGTADTGLSLSESETVIDKLLGNHYRYKNGKWITVELGEQEKFIKLKSTFSHAMYGDKIYLGTTTKANLNKPDIDRKTFYGLVKQQTNYGDTQYKITLDGLTNTNTDTTKDTHLKGVNTNKYVEQLINNQGALSKQHIYGSTSFTGSELADNSSNTLYHNTNATFDSQYRYYGSLTSASTFGDSQYANDISVASVNSIITATDFAGNSLQLKLLGVEALLTLQTDTTAYTGSHTDSYNCVYQLSSEQTDIDIDIYAFIEKIINNYEYSTATAPESYQQHITQELIYNQALSIVGHRNNEETHQVQVSQITGSSDKLTVTLNLYDASGNTGTAIKDYISFPRAGETVNILGNTFKVEKYTGDNQDPYNGNLGFSDTDKEATFTLSLVDAETDWLYNVILDQQHELIASISYEICKKLNSENPKDYSNLIAISDFATITGDTKKIQITLHAGIGVRRYNTYYQEVENNTIYGATSYQTPETQDNTNALVTNNTTHFGAVNNNKTYGSIAYREGQWNEAGDTFTGTHKNTNAVVTDTSTHYGSYNKKRTYGATAYLNPEASARNTNATFTLETEYLGSLNKTEKYGSNNYIVTESIFSSRDNYEKHWTSLGATAANSIAPWAADLASTGISPQTNVRYRESLQAPQKGENTNLDIHTNINILGTHRVEIQSGSRQYQSVNGYNTNLPTIKSSNHLGSEISTNINGSFSYSNATGENTNAFASAEDTVERLMAGLNIWGNITKDFFPGTQQSIDSFSSGIDGFGQEAIAQLIEKTKTLYNLQVIQLGNTSSKNILIAYSRNNPNHPNSLDVSISPGIMGAQILNMSADVIRGLLEDLHYLIDDAGDNAQGKNVNKVFTILETALDSVDNALSQSKVSADATHAANTNYLYSCVADIGTNEDKDDFKQSSLLTSSVREPLLSQLNLVSSTNINYEYDHDLGKSWESLSKSALELLTTSSVGGAMGCAQKIGQLALDGSWFGTEPYNWDTTSSSSVSVTFTEPDTGTDVAMPFRNEWQAKEITLLGNKFTISEPEDSSSSLKLQLSSGQDPFANLLQDQISNLEHNYNACFALSETTKDIKNYTQIDWSKEWDKITKDLVQLATDKSHYRNRISVGQIIGHRNCSARYTVYPRVGKHTYNQYLAGNTTASVHGALSYIDTEGNNTNFPSTNSSVTYGAYTNRVIHGSPSYNTGDTNTNLAVEQTNEYFGAVTNSNTYGSEYYRDQDANNTNLDFSNTNTYLGKVTNSNTYGSEYYRDQDANNTNLDFSNTNTYLGKVTNSNTYGSAAYIDTDKQNTNLAVEQTNEYFGAVTNSNTYGSEYYIDQDANNTNLEFSNTNTYLGAVTNSNTYGSTAYIDTEKQNTNLELKEEKTIFGSYTSDFTQGNLQYNTGGNDAYNTNLAYSQTNAIYGPYNVANTYGSSSFHPTDSESQVYKVIAHTDANKFAESEIELTLFGVQNIGITLQYNAAEITGVSPASSRYHPYTLTGPDNIYTLIETLVTKPEDAEADSGEASTYEYNPNADLKSLDEQELFRRNQLYTPLQQLLDIQEIDDGEENKQKANLQTVESNGSKLTITCNAASDDNQLRLPEVNETIQLLGNLFKVTSTNNNTFDLELTKNEDDTEKPWLYNLANSYQTDFTTAISKQVSDTLVLPEVRNYIGIEAFHPIYTENGYDTQSLNQATLYLYDDTGVRQRNSYYQGLDSHTVLGATSYIDTENQNKNTNAPVTENKTVYGEYSSANTYGSTSYIDTAKQNTNLAVTEQKTVYGLNINNFKQGDYAYQTGGDELEKTEQDNISDAETKKDDSQKIVKANEKLIAKIPRWVAFIEAEYKAVIDVFDELYEKIQEFSEEDGTIVSIDSEIDSITKLEVDEEHIKKRGLSKWGWDVSVKIDDKEVYNRSQAGEDYKPLTDIRDKLENLPLWEKNTGKITRDDYKKIKELSEHIKDKEYEKNDVHVLYGQDYYTYQEAKAKFTQIFGTEKDKFTTKYPDVRITDSLTEPNNHIQALNIRKLYQALEAARKKYYEEQDEISNAVATAKLDNQNHSRISNKQILGQSVENNIYGLEISDVTAGNKNYPRPATGNDLHRSNTYNGAVYECSSNQSSKASMHTYVKNVTQSANHFAPVAKVTTYSGSEDELIPESVSELVG